MDFSTQFEKIKSSVVIVHPVDENGQPLSKGTGVVIGDGRHVLTCSHCIDPNYRNVVKFYDNDTGHHGEVLYNNPNVDIAVLKFSNVLGPGVLIKNSGTVKIGQEAFVVGFPNNILQITALSANIAGFEPGFGFEAIRIDSSINHGNSGGPLFNDKGELVGIVNAKHGRLSDFLENVQHASSGALLISGVGGVADPIEILKKLVKEMSQNLNLGIGYAIPVNVIGEEFNYIKPLIKI